VGSGDGAVEGTAADQKGGGGVTKFKFEDYRLEPEHLKTLKPGAGTIARAKSKTVSGIRRREAFAIVPLWWAERAAKAGHCVNLMVCVELVYRAWRVRGSGKTFVMPNSRGTDYRTKINTLRALEQAGLITVQWRERRSPIVTLKISIF
jgi:hypothetical protein